MNMPIIETRDLHKWYSGVHALKGVSLKVESGEAVGLVGDDDLRLKVSADSALTAPSAASAARLVKLASLVNSMALLDVGNALYRLSNVSTLDAPGTTPGLRSGATVASLPVTVFFTSARAR